MKVYLIICDGGDGSASIRYHKNLDIVKILLEDKEDYYMNEGCWDTIEVADDFMPTGGFDDEFYTNA